jgi:hypothetical protein
MKLSYTLFFLKKPNILITKKYSNQAQDLPNQWEKQKYQTTKQRTPKKKIEKQIKTPNQIIPTSKQDNDWNHHEFKS